MNTGMLWFDNNPKTALRDKIIRAADYYRKKYGSVPTVCEVNRKQYEALDLGVMKVIPAGNVLLHHLLVGMAD